MPILAVMARGNKGTCVMGRPILQPWLKQTTQCPFQYALNNKITFKKGKADVAH